MTAHLPVDYNDAIHRYSHKGTTYTSATQLIEQFVQPFDVKERSEYMAYRYGNTPQYWRDKWKAENKKSLVRGTGIHDQQEADTYAKRFIQMSPTALPVLRYHPVVPYAKLEDGVYPEMLLWSHDHRLAGRSDKVILHSWGYTDPVRTADIEDYKTNKKINRESYQDSKGQHRMMRFPLEHVMDCEYWHYALQLSIYQFILEQYGYQPGHRRIIHFPHQVEGLMEPTPVIYDLPYMRKEVELMLEYRKEALEFV